MNWGYGGMAPVQPGCTIVDLSAMDAIRNASEISAACPVAVIEPGVTQAQLHAFLRANVPTLGFNVTGSASSSSLLGNALDRGVGYSGPRYEDVFGLEVVLGTGEVLRTGFRRLGEASPLVASHPHGLGPIADGLFFQGNFGIVTSACFRLLRKRPIERALLIGLNDAARLGEFLGRLIDLKRDGLLTSVAHVGNAARVRATLRASLADYLQRRCEIDGPALERNIDGALALVAGTPWTALAGLSGNLGQTRAVLAEVRGRFSGLARVRSYDGNWLVRCAWVADRLRALPAMRRVAAALAAVGPLQQLALGTPTDIAFDNLLRLYDPAGLTAPEYERSRCGVLFVSPALPMDGPFVQRFVAELERVAQRHGHELFITLNVETEHSLVGIVNLLFDNADAEQHRRALACAEAMYALVHASGLEVYRARTDQMAAVVGRDPMHWALLRQLKDAWDPDGVIAPGRYSA